MGSGIFLKSLQKKILATFCVLIFKKPVQVCVYFQDVGVFLCAKIAAHAVKKRTLFPSRHTTATGAISGISLFSCVPISLTDHSYEHMHDNTFRGKCSQIEGILGKKSLWRMLLKKLFLKFFTRFHATPWGYQKLLQGFLKTKF